jgi:uncharacterized membrane protein
VPGLAIRVQELWRSKWWLPIVSIFAAARITTFLLFLAIAQIQEENYWTPAQPGYFDFLNIWDAEWYERIYSGGYPTVLPTNENGSVQQNAWAFMPVFPFIIRGLNVITGIEFKFLAPIVATIFGFVFVLMAYRLLILRITTLQARWAIALISFSMASPISRYFSQNLAGLSMIVAMKPSTEAAFMPLRRSARRMATPVASGSAALMLPRCSATAMNRSRCSRRSVSLFSFSASVRRPKDSRRWSRAWQRPSRWPCRPGRPGPTWRGWTTTCSRARSRPAPG